MGALCLHALNVCATDYLAKRNASLNDPMFCRFVFTQMAAIVASDGGDDADSDKEVEEEDEDPSQLQGPTHRSQASKVRDLRWHCMHAS